MNYFGVGEWSVFCQLYFFVTISEKPYYGIILKNIWGGKNQTHDTMMLKNGKYLPKWRTTPEDKICNICRRYKQVMSQQFRRGDKSENSRTRWAIARPYLWKKKMRPEGEVPVACKLSY